VTSVRPAPELEAEEAEVDLGKYGHALLERWWLLLVGLVVGAVIGYLTTLGGTRFYRAQAVLYMGQPIATNGAPLQSLNTNPSSVHAIVTAQSVVAPVAARAGLTPGKIRSHTSVTAVAGYLSKLGQTPLVQVTVEGSAAAKVARAANLLSSAVVSRVGVTTKEKIAILAGVLKNDDAAIGVVNTALSATSLSSTDKLILQLRLQSLQADRANTAQLLAIARHIEAPRIVTYAAAQKTSARSHRNSAAVGGLIGLILGGIAALVWEPLTRRRRVL
jgi:uncharacterized protein involved in exopolysaccharide biosynthesis